MGVSAEPVRDRSRHRPARRDPTTTIRRVAVDSLERFEWATKTLARGTDTTTRERVTFALAFARGEDLARLLDAGLNPIVEVHPADVLYVRPVDEPHDERAPGVAVEATVEDPSTRLSAYRAFDGIFYVAGSLDVVTVGAFEARAAALEATADEVVVDLGDLLFLDRVGIAALLRLAERVSPTTIVLRGPRPNVARVLDAAGVLGNGFRIVMAGRRRPAIGIGGG